MRSLISPATLAAALMVGGLDGCGGGQPDLTVTSIGNHQVYRQPFTQAYASWRNGDLEIVLADDAAVSALSSQPTGAPVRQILHVHVLWHPDHGMGNTAPVTNATLHWYVLGDPTRRPGDLLEYTGTAYVTFGGDPDSPTISIQNASLKCAYQHGLCDPVGPSRIDGSVTATTDDTRVSRLLREVEDAAAPPNASTTAPASPTAAVGQ
jgi:hypothetical protein